MPTWLTSATSDSVWSTVRTPADVWLLVRVVCFALAVPWLMRLPLPRLLPGVTPPPARIVDHYRAYQTVAFVLAYMRRLGRRGPNPCTVRSLTLYHFLRRSGLDATIHFGLDPSTRTGHAWISYRGLPWLEAEDPTSYLEMLRYPGPNIAPVAMGGDTARVTTPAIAQQARRKEVTR